MGNFNANNNVASLSKLSGLASGVGTFLGTPSSANLLAALTTKTGTGNSVFSDSPTLVTPTLGAASATSINGLTISSSTGTFSLANGKTLTVSNTLTFTGTDSSSVAFGAGGTVLYSGGALISTSPTAGVGYGTGAGDVVIQATSKSTGVTLDKVTGKITMNSAALAAATTVTFVLTNSTIAATDTVSISIVSGEATDASYQILPPKVAAGSCKITVWNITSGSLSEALVLQFNVHKGAIS